jgi:hypothetical protein
MIVPAAEWFRLGASISTFQVDAAPSKPMSPDQKTKMADKQYEPPPIGKIVNLTTYQIQT